MKTIGLIGGMSWESSADYYRIMNEETKKQLGGLHSAKILINSVDFAEVEELQHAGAWQQLTCNMIDWALQLECGGADFVLIGTNTMHKMAEDVQAAIQIPLLHIADATAKRIKAAGVSRVALLGTKFTMEEDFYKGRLTDKFGIEVIIPDDADRAEVHRIIYDELCQGQVKEESKEKYREIIRRLEAAGSEGIILGCTEIQMLVGEADSSKPVFDTTRIHAEAAVEMALAD